jgi:hypothetical protein
LRARIRRLIDEGQRISRFPSIDRIVAEAPDWQDRGYDLLDSALVEIVEAQMFAQLGTPIEGITATAGLGHRISLQVQFLAQLQRRLDSLHIKESWQP